MSVCNCSGCPHAANCRCVCLECNATPVPIYGFFRGRPVILSPTLGPVPFVGDDDPPGLAVAEDAGSAEKCDEPQIIHVESDRQ